MAKNQYAKRHKWKKCGYLAKGYVQKPWWDCKYDAKNTRAILKRHLLREIQESAT